MPSWCGRHWSPSCIYTSAASGCFFVALVALLLGTLWKARTHASRQIEAQKRRMRTREVVLIACFGGLAVLHIASLITLASTRQLALMGYFSEGLFLGAWLIALGMAVGFGPRRVWTALRWAAWQAALLYGVLLFMHAWNAGTSSMDLVFVFLHVAELALIITAAITTIFKPDAAGPAGYAPLAGAAAGADVEQGPEVRERSWYSLIGTAMKHIWPERATVQARVWLCVAIVVAQRVVNLAVPILYKDVINRASEIASAISSGSASHTAFTFMQAFYPYALAYIVIAYVQGSLGSAGLLKTVRAWLWQPVSQDAYKRISIRLFNHMMNLDLRFHLMRRTGEISKICDRGTDAMQEILSMVLFGTFPQLFDVLVSCAYLAYALEPWIALVVFVLLITYIPLSIYMTEKKGQIRKELNQYDNDIGACLTEALLNYETVKNFGNEAVESTKLSTAIDKYQGAEFTLIMAFNIVSLLQGTIVFCATSLGLVLCLKGIVEGRMSVGDLVLFLSLMAQLYGPLNYFANLYRQVQKNMMNMDKMLGLLEIEPTVKDRPGAKSFTVGNSTLEFDNVSFSYAPDHPVLKNVSFKIEGGKTLALVGSTGSGKSTTLRLIFRYFDPLSGSVKVDGQDLRDVTLKSFRDYMAVVPQDTVLFNSSVRDNIRYGRPGCSDEEVEQAARLCAIHDSITTRFPQGYDTVVGERGLRLSGGEKQRVAFARALLKNPAMLLLDEATSSLDTLTERRIQSALAESRAQRTTVIVAHRLSTIMDADHIVCFQEGKVAEQGSHAELMQLRGLYYELWTKQEISKEDDAGSSSSSSISTNDSNGKGDNGKTEILK